MAEPQPQPPFGNALGDSAEMLFRNVRRPFVDQNGLVSSQAFEPCRVDEKLLSLDRATLTTPKKSFDYFESSAPSNKSAGVLAVSVGDCTQQEVPAHENPIAGNAAHCVADFRAHGKSQGKNRARILRDLAVKRSWLHRAKGFE